MQNIENRTGGVVESSVSHMFLAFFVDVFKPGASCVLSMNPLRNKKYCDILEKDITWVIFGAGYLDTHDIVIMKKMRANKCTKLVKLGFNSFGDIFFLPEVWSKKLCFGCDLGCLKLMLDANWKPKLDPMHLFGGLI